MADLPDPSDRLDSWKEIAGFLGRTVRTVQRWEKTEGLPVHRGGTAKRGSIVGSRKEIGEWWHRRRDTLEPTAVVSEREDSQRRRWLEPLLWLAGAAAVIVGLVVWLAPRNSRSSPDDPPLDAGSLRHVRLLASSTGEGRSIREIPLGAEPALVVASPVGERVYVGLTGERAVAVVDVASGKVIDRLAVSDRPDILAIGPDADRLYVGAPTGLTIVNLETRAMERIATDSGVRGLAVTAGGQRVWISLAQAGLRVLDVATGRMETRPTVGCPMQFASDARTGRLYVSYQCAGPGGSWGHDAIELIDEATRRSLVAKAGPPMVGHMLTLASGGSFLWADAHDGCSTRDYDQVGCPPGKGAVLHAFNADTLDPVTSVRIPSLTTQSTPVSFPDGTRLAVRAGGIHIVNAALGHVEERIDIPELAGIAFMADGSRLVATLRDRRALAVFPLSQAPDARQFNALAGYWPGDGTGNDLAGGTHPVAGSAPNFAPGRMGQAFRFDGQETDGLLSFGKRLEADAAIEVVTMAAWVKTMDAGTPRTLVDRSGGVGWRWWITAEGRPAFCLTAASGVLSCDGGGLVSTSAVAPGTWHHLAVARSETTLTLYIDGVVGAAAPLGDHAKQISVTYDDRFETRVGSAASGTGRFRGLIDELVLFRRVLSPDEIARVGKATQR